MPDIDLNCDMGEGFGAYKMGDDVALLEHVTSANIACGFHAGDPGTIARTVKAAVARGVAVGAHPGLPDLQGFGRRDMKVSEAEAYDMVVYQIGAVQAFAAAAGSTLSHVKIHGALYNMAIKDEALSRGICRAVHDVNAQLLLYALSGSVTERVARELGIPVACEAFADRSYQDDGSLTPRSKPGAMITDVDQSIAQVRRMVADGIVRSQSGKDVRLHADTICVHGDQPGAVEFARRLRAALEADGIAVRSPDVQRFIPTATS
ncbi:MAG: lactam utilization protein LamB [Rhizobacter sp.]|nr:lactam utilization protein LamB [Rhizobacter sp.]